MNRRTHKSRHIKLLAGNLALALAALAAALAGVSLSASPVPQSAMEGKKYVKAVQVHLVPSSGRQGQTLHVTAEGLPYSQALRLSFAPKGLTVSNMEGTPASAPTNAIAAVPSTPASPVSFTLTISRNARPGVYTFLIGTPDGVFRVPAAFTVLARPGPLQQVVPPRINRVTPQDLERGKTYTLNLFGDAFRQGMRVSFGHDLQNLGPAVVLDSHRAEITVLVQPSAVPGVHLAQAAGMEGPFEKGPGGIQVVEKRGGLRPAPPPVLDIKHLKPGVVKPHGHITLWAPNRKNGEPTLVQAAGETPVVQRGALFTWVEDNPGVAKYFVLYIKDKDGKVIAEAQTPASRPYYRVTTAFLKGLPSPDSLPYFDWTPPAPVIMKPVVKASKNASPRYPPYILPASMSSQAGGGGSQPSSQVSSTIKPEDLRNYINANMSQSALTQIDLHGLTHVGYSNATWQVKGFWKNPISGEAEAVESSMSLPLRLPAAPTGLFNCDAAAKGGKINLQSGGGGAVPTTGKPVLLSGQVDFGASPYRLTSPFYVILLGMSGGGNHLTSYNNVYVSWGDGDVERLSVDNPQAKSTVIELHRNGQPLSHIYHRAGTFQVKVYVMPDGKDENPEAAAVFSSNSVYGQAVQAYYRGAPSSNTGSSSVVPSVSLDLSGGSKGTQAEFQPESSAQADMHAPSSIKLPGEDAYLLACGSVEVQEPLDETAYGPLHLKHVEIVFPGQSKTPPEATDCSESFTGTARISYYGMVKIALGWIVDGGEEIVQEPADGIGPGSKTPLAQVEIQSPPLPVSLQGSPHHLKVRVWVVSDSQASSVSSESGGSSMGASGGGSSGSGTTTSLVGMTVMRPNQVSYAGLGKSITVSGGGSGSSSGSSSASSGGAYLPFLMHVKISLPDREVTSDPVEYKVVAHDPSVPCNLTFPTRDGDFTISDIGSNFHQAGNGTWSGSGKLKLKLPEGTSGAKQVFVPVTFSGWSFSGGAGGRTVANGGSLDVAANTAIHVIGLQGKITHVSGTAGHSQPLSITLSLKLSSFSGLVLPGSVPPWSVTGPITPEGDFYKEGLSLVHAGIGVSGFGLDGVTLALDLSRSQGTAPAGDSCNPAGTGTSWTGLYIQSGTLKLNLFGRTFKSIPEPSIEGWSIGPSGLSGHLGSVALNASASWELATLKLNTLDFDVCSSSLSAKYHLQLEHVPVINTTLSGTLQIGYDGSVAGDFSVPDLEKHFAMIDMKVHNANFKNEAGVGWRLGMDVRFSMEAAGKNFYSFDLNGLRVKLNGSVALEGGAASINLPIGGKANLGPVQIEMNQVALKVGAKSGHSYFEFSFGGGFHLSSVLSVSASHVKYRLVSQGSTWHGEGPFVDNIKLHGQFPDGPSPTVLLDVSLSYKHDSGRTVFS
ncbi:MAG: hypothetical protein P8018_10245, partial [Acidobacteriota bacterium]